MTTEESALPEIKPAVLYTVYTMDGTQTEHAYPIDSLSDQLLEDVRTKLEYIRDCIAEIRVFGLQYPASVYHPQNIAKVIVGFRGTEVDPPDVERHIGFQPVSRQSQRGQPE